MPTRKSPPVRRVLDTAPSAALRDFLATETAGGVFLIVAAVVALVWANSPWQAAYETFWHTPLGIDFGRHGIELDLRHWVNDGLMAIFFLVVGLEIKRELLLGELRDPRRAALPVFAAIGGMVVPAVIYLLVNSGQGAAADGWGIPVATDIAFAIGVLALVAPGLPSGVRLFLLTLAIVDDIGAIVLIAIFYTSKFEVGWLALAVGIVLAILVLQRLGFRAAPLFGTLGIGLWLALHASGVHATLAGVAMGLLAPSTAVLDRQIIRSRADQLVDVFSPKAARETTRIARKAVSELEWLEDGLHDVSSLLIVPLFALANAGVVMSSDSLRDAATSSIALGAVLGLVLGKAIGITVGAWIGTKLRLATLPDGVTWHHVIGVAALGGIGFTVSIFISTLAFDDAALVDEAKIGVLAASLIATLFGSAILLVGRRGATTK
ncbi:MAG: Na+/H+ antiporter NhaA [Acidimicrobiales bacterium]|nr:Na+/H+ antiporter NhaA [Acidimicrobiales bacterium]